MLRLGAGAISGNNYTSEEFGYSPAHPSMASTIAGGEEVAPFGRRASAEKISRSWPPGGPPP